MPLALSESFIVPEPAVDAESRQADAQPIKAASDQPDTEPVADEPDPVTARSEPVATVPAESDPATTARLQSITYAMEVHRLRQAFEEMTSDKSALPDLAIALRQYLTAAGVELGTSNTLTGFGDSGRAWRSPSGHSFLFNERNGRLLIRATADEHALVTDALGLLLPVSQQILIEVKFIEVTEPLHMPASQNGLRLVPRQYTDDFGNQWTSPSRHSYRNQDEPSNHQRARESHKYRHQHHDRSHVQRHARASRSIRGKGR